MIKNLNRSQEILYIKWDNKDETLDIIRDRMLPLVNGNKYSDGVKSVGRCYNEKTDKNDSNVMFVSTKYEDGNSNSYHRIGEVIVLDYSPLCKYGTPEVTYYLRGYDKDVFERYYGDLLK